MNLYSLPLLIAVIFNLGLGGFIFWKDIKKLANRTFFFWVLCMGIWNFGVLMMYITLDKQVALLWVKILQCAVVFIPTAFFHFVLAVTDKRNWVNSGLLWLTYTLSVFYLIVNVIDKIFIRDIVRYSWGYYPVIAPVGFLFNITFGIYVIYSIFLLWSSARASFGLKRIQLNYVFAASLVGYGGGFTNFLPLYGVQIYPIGNLLNVILSLVVAYAITKFRFLTLSPVPEDYLLGEAPYKLETGYSYLVKQASPKKGFEVFTTFVTHGVAGLCITTTSPPEIREKYKLLKTPIIYLTPKEIKGENCVAPVELPLLLNTISDFVRKTKESIIILDDLNYLIQYNRGGILDFILNLGEAISRNNSRLLILVSPEMVDPRSKDLIEPCMNPIRHIFPLKRLLFELVRNDPQLKLAKTVTKYGFTEAEFLIGEGSSYLLKGKEPDQGFRLFQELLSAGYPGLCISKEPPMIVKEKYEITKGSIYWFSELTSPDCIDPRDLKGLLDIIDNFIEQNKSSVILLDGFEFLTTFSGFSKVLETIEKIKSLVALRNSRLILPVGVYLLDDKEMVLLSKNMELL